MVKSVVNGTSLAPFLVKCYDMVIDESTDELISWNESNNSFIIWDEAKLASQLLPKYFKHSNFSSFVRQLNIYGFKKIDSDRWEFANEDFIKGEKHLLKNIIRRKHPQNLVQTNSSQQKDTTTPTPSEDDKITELWNEVENLKIGKSALTQELKKLSLHHQTSRSKLLLLREQLKGVEKHQQQMLSFIGMVMQNPEFLVQFLKPKEGNWRKETGKSKLSEVLDDYEEIPLDGAIVKYQPIKDGDEMASKSEDPMEFNFSSDEMRDLLMNFDLLGGPTNENLPTLENYGQIVLPDIPEYDAMLDQLLLSSPLEQNEEFSRIENGFFQQKELIESNGSDDEIDEDINKIV